MFNQKVHRTDTPIASLECIQTLMAFQRPLVTTMLDIPAPRMCKHTPGGKTL